MNPLTIQLDQDGLWRFGLFFGMLGCILFFINFYRKQIGWIPSITWGYVLIWCLIRIEWPSFPFGGYNTAFVASAGQTFAEVLVIPAVFVALREKELKRFFYFLNGFMLLESAMVCIFGYGFMVGPSFDTALLAAFLPLASPAVRLISMAVILTHHGSTAILIIIAQQIAFYIKKEKKTCADLCVRLAGSAALIAIAYFHHHGPWFDGMERIQAYKRFMGFWWSRDISTNLFGTGPGSFIWLSMMIDKFKDPVFLQMHSDWLQVTFELGIIGVSLLILLALKTAKDSWSKPRILASSFGCVAFMFTYHPLRFMPSMIVFSFIFSLSINYAANKKYKIENFSYTLTKQTPCWQWIGN